MKMILLLASLFSLSAFAEVTNFKCSFTDVTYVNQFELTGSVEHEDGEFSDAVFNFSLRTAGHNPRFATYSVVRSGIAQVFEAGEFYTKRTVRLASAVKGDELEYINILVDVPPLHSSSIRFLNEMTYYGSCKSF